MARKQRRLVLGDIHGEYDFLKQVLEGAKVDYENDLVIQIGDIVDRGLEPFKCMDELLKIKNLVLIKGNHDQSFIHYLHNNFDILGDSPSNGTQITKQRWRELDEEYKRYYQTMVFDRMKYYHVTKDNIAFVHGGFNREHPLKDQDIFTYTWDRELVKESMSCKGDQKLKTVENFSKIFIGHTPTIYWEKLTPIISGGVINVDTGSGKGGPLTIMDIDTLEFWQSDIPEKMKKYVNISKGKTSTEETIKKKEEGDSEEEISRAA